MTQLMDLDELRSVQRTEREKSQLQHLRDSFYSDVAAYVEGRKDEYRSRLANADDPFAASEDAEHLKDEVETAQQVVEALYERRVGKVVKMAAFAAAGMGADEEGLTTEERSLFDDLVARIERNRETVLDRVGGDTGGDSGRGSEAGSEAPEATGDGRPPEGSPDASGPVSESGDRPPADEYAPEVVGDAASRSPDQAADAPESPSPGTAPGTVEDGPERAPDGDVLSEAMGGPGGGDAEADTERPPAAGTEDRGPSAPEAGAGTAEPGDQRAPPSAGPDPDPDTGPEPGAESGSGPDPGPTGGREPADEAPRASDPAEGPGVDVAGDPLSADGTDAAGSPGASRGDGNDVREVTAADLDPSAPGVTATGGEPTPDRAAGSGEEPATPTTTAAADADADPDLDPDPKAGGGDPERVTVRVTGQVGEVYGVDGRAYDLAPEDVVTLPADNAAPLLDADAAERLE